MAKDSPQSKYSEQYILNNVYDQILRTLAITGWGWNGQTATPDNANNLILQLDYDGGQNPVYIGYAAPGTATSSAFWLIRKLAFNGDSNVTSILYAGGVATFTSVWDDRASLSYS